METEKTEENGKRKKRKKTEETEKNRKQHRSGDPFCEIPSFDFLCLTGGIATFELLLL